MTEQFHSILAAIKADSEAMDFPMGSDDATGRLLKTLAASKPGGNILEIGTGTGLSTCWLADGLSCGALLTTLEMDEAVMAVARKHLGHRGDITWVAGDGADFILQYSGPPFDLIFADSWPGKYFHLEETLALLAPGGLYVIDDMLPQPNWPEGHDVKADALLDELQSRTDLASSFLVWSTGILIACKE